MKFWLFFWLYLNLNKNWKCFELFLLKITSAFSDLHSLSLTHTLSFSSFQRLHTPTHLWRFSLNPKCLNTLLHNDSYEQWHSSSFSHTANNNGKIFFPHLPEIWVIRGQFHQHSTSSFYARRSRKRKKAAWFDKSFLRFWDLQASKLLVERWWNWHHVASFSSSSSCSNPTLKTIFFLLLNQFSEFIYVWLWVTVKLGYNELYGTTQISSL